MSSNLLEPSMNLGWSSAVLVGVALLLGTGCDALGVRPGHDFAVAILNAQPVQAVGLVTVPLRVAVSGCDAVQAEVVGTAGRHALEIERQPDGTWSSPVPVEWLRGDDGTCTFDATAPQASTADLVVTCLDAGRSIATDLTVSYATAAVARDLGQALDRLTVEAIAPSALPLVPFTLAPSGLQQAAELYPVVTGIPFYLDGPSYIRNPLVRTRMVARDGLIFLNEGCPPGVSCPPVPFPGTPGMESTRIQGYQVDDAGGYGGHVGRPILVPADVTDMAFAADGALVVVSQGYDSVSRPTGAVISRVVLSADRASMSVTVIGYYPGEWVESRLATRADGTLAFLTYEVPAVSGPIRTVLYVVDGEAVTRTMDPTGDLYIGEVTGAGSGFGYVSVQLSPDAKSIVVAGLQEGPPGGPFVALPAVDRYWLDGDVGGAAWLDGAFALWKGQSLLWGSTNANGNSLEVFEGSPPHARRYGYQVEPLPGATGTVVLHGATAVGDKLVLTTSTGLRVLGPDGTLIGGADPLPCRLSPTTVAVRTGPTQVAFGAGRYLYVFDLAGLKD